MKKIPTSKHAWLDYLAGLLFIAIPYIFGFNRSGMPAGILIGAGLFILIYSLVTGYEYSLTPLISVKLNLILDVLTGLFVAASPWLFKFQDEYFLTHVIPGVVLIVVAVISDSIPLFLKRTINPRVPT